MVVVLLFKHEGLFHMRFQEVQRSFIPHRGRLGMRASLLLRGRRNGFCLPRCLSRSRRCLFRPLDVFSMASLRLLCGLSLHGGQPYMEMHCLWCITDLDGPALYSTLCFPQIQPGQAVCSCRTKCIVAVSFF